MVVIIKKTPNSMSRSYESCYSLHVPKRISKVHGEEIAYRLDLNKQLRNIKTLDE